MVVGNGLVLMSSLYNEYLIMKNLHTTIHKLLIKRASHDELINLLNWINDSVSNKIEYLIAEDIWVKSYNYVPKVTFRPPNSLFK